MMHAHLPFARRPAAALRVWLALLAAWLLALPANPAASAEAFRVATYNLEGYLDRAAGSRPAKSPEAKARIVQILTDIRPDVLALQEVGGPSALVALRESLKAAGLNLPHSEFVPGFDTNIYVAVLSRFPITARNPHTNANYLLNGRRLRAQRGFAELDIQVTSNYQFTLFVAHLKSRRASPVADESSMRLEEARLLRELVDARLAASPQMNLIVAGDMNDHKNSQALRSLIGRGRSRLIDTRPAEGRPGQGGDAAVRDDARPVTWTHFYAAEDSYARVDYILVSSGMARELIREKTYVYAAPGWGDASDHRPVVATFSLDER